MHTNLNVVLSQSTTLPFKRTNQWKNKPFFRTHSLPLSETLFSNALPLPFKTPFFERNTPSKWFILVSFSTQQVDPHTLSLILKMSCVLGCNLEQPQIEVSKYWYLYLKYFLIKVSPKKSVKRCIFL